MEYKTTAKLVIQARDKDLPGVFGHGCVLLLQGIAREHSLNRAAKSMGMAYSKAWRIIHEAEEGFGFRLLDSTIGGRHGGGAFSGKDCTKVDRSAAYAARWVAKNVVAAGLADRCEVELAYAIGVSKPLSIMVDTFGTAHVAEDKIVEAVEKTFDLRPGAIIRDLDLRRPIYEKTAAYGHFGREDPDFTWEKTDRVEELKAACGL